jgi:hypothetical protein
MWQLWPHLKFEHQEVVRAYSTILQINSYRFRVPLWTFFGFGRIIHGSQAPIEKELLFYGPPPDGSVRDTLDCQHQRKANPAARWRITMKPVYLRGRCLVFASVVSLTCSLVVAADETSLTKEQMKHFLLTAKVVNSRDAKKGVTNTKRLTLSDGTLMHDASFQAIDEHKANMQFATGTELNFVDSYKNNIAAYELAELLGIEDMIPVYVERKWKGQVGSLSWWLPVKMDEVERHRQKLTAPDADAWNSQMYKIRVFDQLVADADINLTNLLIGEDWKIWRIDFTRAFRLNKELKSPEDLVRCDRQLLEKLKSLDGNQLTEKLRVYLNKEQLKAVMARRDKIVAVFQNLIAGKGERYVLY